MPDRFPIYRLSSDAGTVSQLASHGRRLFNITDDFQLNQRGNSRVLRNGNHVVEVAGESGGTWSADESQLWKPGLRPQLLSEKDAAARAERLVAEHQLLPKLAAPFRFGKPAIGGTHVEGCENRKARGSPAGRSSDISNLCRRYADRRRRGRFQTHAGTPGQHDRLLGCVARAGECL